MDRRTQARQLGMNLFEPGERAHLVAEDRDPYYYETFVGTHEIPIARGDCAFWLSPDLTVAQLTRGPQVIQSSRFATLVRGFAPETKTSTLGNKTVLPYINGCSTKQIFPPDRPGDPTLQMLFMPPHCREQQHHIHPTARAVFVLAGQGRCQIGMGPGGENIFDLTAGMTCVIQPMTPHHFETGADSLLVLPVHIWSTVRGAESGHPMIDGTFRV